MGAECWLPGTLLARISPPVRAEILGLGTRRRVAAGNTILREGDTGSYVVLLLDALAKVTLAMADGRHALLGIRVSGDLVGEVSALNETPRSATVVAGRTCVVSVIHAAQLRAFLRRRPDAAVELVGTVAERLRWADQRRVDFASYPAKVRLARILADIASRHGCRRPSGVVIGIRFTQTELATLCGAAEVTTHKALRDLRTSGVVDTGYRQIVVRDMVALRELADLDE
jgi:CRP-like cAMP-binding protein